MCLIVGEIELLIWKGRSNDGCEFSRSANPEAYLSQVKDVTAVDKSTILFKIAQHYVHESENLKAKVAAECAFKSIVVKQMLYS